MGQPARIALTICSVVAASAQGAFAASGFAAQVLRVDPRAPLTFILNAPAGEIGSASRSEIIRAMAKLVEVHTDLRLETVEEAVVNECRGQLACLTTKAWRDDRLSERRHRLRKRDELSASPALQSAERAGTDPDGVGPRFLVLLSIVPLGEGGDQAFAILLDTQRAIALVEHAEPAAGWRVELEIALKREAVLVATERETIHGPESMAAYLGRLVREDFAPVLDARGHFEPFGGIEIEWSSPMEKTPQAGLGFSAGTKSPTSPSHTELPSLFVDDVAVGALAAGLNTIMDVRPGRRRLRLETAGHAPLELTLSVARGHTTVVAAPALEALRRAAPTDAWPAGRASAAAVGAGSLVAGAVFIAVGLAKQGEVATGCFDCEASRTFITLGSTATQPETWGRGNVNPPGLMLAPLGLSLAAGGGVLAGFALFGEWRDGFPWWVAGAAAAASALTYGTCMLLDGSRPEPRQTVGRP